MSNVLDIVKIFYDQDTNEKKSHKEVNYRNGTSGEHCGICTMYRQPNSCTAVEDPIYPSGLCNIFEGR